MSIAPMYVTFGDQKHQIDDSTSDKKFESCTLKQSTMNHEFTNQDAKDKMEQGIGCQMTTIAQIYNKILLTVPMFALIYYILSWIFIGFFIFFLVYHSYYKRAYQSHSLKGYTTLGQNDDDDQDDDLQLFLSRKSYKEDNPGLS